MTPQRDRTRERLLDAAEELFGDHGLNGVSLRGVMAAAAANPSSVHYHFGSKDSLIEAVVLRRMSEIVDVQAVLLDEVAPAANVEGLVRAVVHPVRDLVRDEAGRRYVRFVARLFADRSSPLVAAVVTHFRPHMVRLAAMFAAALPDLPKHVLAVRTSITFDVVLQEMARWDEVVQPWVARSRRQHLDEFAEHLAAYVAAGLVAPVPASVLLRHR